MIPVDDCLAALGVRAQPPGERFLEELFAAFNAKVPFESASRIVRRHRAREADPAALMPGAGEFWADYLESGSGGTCFARVEAFAALAGALGFAARRILGAVEKAGDHAALLVEVDGRTRLADVGFPLPGVLPIEEHEGILPLAHYRWERCGAEGRFVFLSGPRGGQAIRFDLTEAPAPLFRERWRASGEGATRFLENVVLLRQEGHRSARFFRGTVCLDDAHTRTRIPLRDDRARKLSEIFEISEETLRDAFAAVGDPEPESPAARVEAFRLTPRAGELFELVATPEGYRRFLRGVGEARVTASGPDRFRVALAGPDGAELIEEVSVDRARGVLAARRSAGLARTGFRLETSRPLPRLVRYAELPDPREEFLRNDLGRGRLAGLLAMDLLALARLEG